MVLSTWEDSCVWEEAGCSVPEEAGELVCAAEDSAGCSGWESETVESELPEEDGKEELAAEDEKEEVWLSVSVLLEEEVSSGSWAKTEYSSAPKPNRINRHSRHVPKQRKNFMAIIFTPSS
jgi:hypothetical protein